MINTIIIKKIVALRKKLFKQKEPERITDAAKAINWVEHCIHRAKDVFIKKHGQIYFWYCIIYNPRYMDAYTTRDNEIYTFNAAVEQDYNKIQDIVFSINLKMKAEHEKIK